MVIPGLLTAQVQVQSQGSLCGIFCEYSGTGTGSSATSLLSAASFCSMNAAFSCVISDWYNRLQYQGSQSHLIQLVTVTTCPAQQLETVIMPCWAELYCKNFVGEK